MRLAPAIVALLALSSTARLARAEDPSSMHVLVAAGGAKTERGSDAAALTALKIGYQTNDWLSFHLFNRFGYGAENRRFLTFISLGAQLSLDLDSVAPYFRFALAHQHEERVSTFKNNPLTSLLGAGPGIHHRGGAETAIGLEVPLNTAGELQAFAAIEASTIYFFDGNGPRLYAGGTVGLGFNYAL